MIAKTWMWVRALGSLCALGCMLSVACSDSEGNGGIGGSGGGGTGGSGNGGTGNGGSGNGGTGLDDAGSSECSCGGLSDCPATLAELCADLPEGCPEQLDTWLTCAERGQIAPRDGVGELYLRDCDGHRMIHRQANYIGKRAWFYDEQGRFVGIWNIDDSGLGPRCGEILSNTCRFGDQGELLVRPDATDAGSDAGSSGDADSGAADSGVADAGSADGGAVLECSQL